MRDDFSPWIKESVGGKLDGSYHIFVHFLCGSYILIV